MTGVLTHRATILACLAALAIGLAGCGSSSSGGNRVSATTYATALCQSVGPFETDIASRQSALNPANIKNAQQGKTALVGFLTAIAADTQTATNKLKAAGVPNVKDGQKIAAAFVGLFQRLGTTLNTAATQAKSLPTGSPQAFKTAAAALGNRVKTSMGNLGASLAGLKSPELESAAKKVKACQTLG